ASDNWFHPVNLTTGPDGALYVVDFYREFVEHPIYVADEKARAEVNWRNGAAHGRIWRIRSHDDDLLANLHPKLSRASSSELVNLLGHSIAWWRNTAQQILVERQDRTVIPQLRKILAESETALTRLHALYVLNGLGDGNSADVSVNSHAEQNSRALDVASLRHALRDECPRIRQHAVRLAAQRADECRDDALREDLVAMADDPDSGVRFQLALGLGSYNHPSATRALTSMLGRDRTPSFHLAIRCGVGRNAWPLVRELVANAEEASRNAALLEQLGEQFASRAD